ncbi:MAG: hypothetical protein GWO44_25750, partial [Thermoplasmata archaeon]|nr:hypothetical protein [Thermoplasmata archaeon]NIY06577.1 hypothetical protein [Thermoplasmata archaeon]
RAGILLSPRGLIDALRRAVAYADLSRVLIAIERYRLGHGDFPDTLDALVPDYIDAVPTDPFTESDPIRYLTYPDRVVVYSIERNRED